MMERIKAIGGFLLIMGVGYFAGMLWTLPTMALQDLSVPYTFGDSDTIYASRFNANYDTIEVRFNQLNDSLDLRFMRSAAWTDGDSTFSLLRVDTIRSNPDIDSIQGRPWVDSINTAYIQVPTIKALDTLRGNPDVDSIKGYPYIDSVNSSMINVTRIYTDSIKGSTYADTLVGMNLIQGNPTADSLTISNILNVTGKIAVDSITGLSYLQGANIAISGKLNADTITTPVIDTIFGGAASNYLRLDADNVEFVGNVNVNGADATGGYVNDKPGLLYSGAYGRLVKSKALSTFIAGTANQITVTDDTTTTYKTTLSLPQSIATTSNVVFNQVSVAGTVSCETFTMGNSPIDSIYTNAGSDSLIFRISGSGIEFAIPLR